jgi:ethanolamine transporter EutH
MATTVFTEAIIAAIIGGLIGGVATYIAAYLQIKQVKYYQQSQNELKPTV